MHWKARSLYCYYLPRGFRINPGKLLATTSRKREKKRGLSPLCLGSPRNILRPSFQENSVVAVSALERVLEDGLFKAIDRTECFEADRVKLDDRIDGRAAAFFTVLLKLKGPLV